MQGLLLIDKPAGLSSFKVVAKVRAIIKASTGQKLKVGHSGTLDPAATGLLILAIGSYTKKLSVLIGHNKTYLVEMILGRTSSTGDQEGQIEAVNDLRPTSLQINQVLKKFTGYIDQIPPAYSAIKINGQRAYKLARKGQNIELPSRRVRVISNQLISYNYPKVVFVAQVSSGTYIRSLVEDIGQQLATGAYTSNLRRTKIGEYHVDSALKLQNINYDKVCKYIINS